MTDLNDVFALLAGEQLPNVRRLVAVEILSDHASDDDPTAIRWRDFLERATRIESTPRLQVLVDDALAVYTEAAKWEGTEGSSSGVDVPTTLSILDLIRAAKQPTSKGGVEQGAVVRLVSTVLESVSASGREPETDLWDLLSKISIARVALEEDPTDPDILPLSSQPSAPTLGQAMFDSCRELIEGVMTNQIRQTVAVMSMEGRSVEEISHVVKLQGDDVKTIVDGLITTLQHQLRELHKRRRRA